MKEFKQSDKDQIIDDANRKDIYIKSNLGLFNAKIAGKNLDYPYIYDNLNLGLTAQISWFVAERLSKGIINTVQI